MVNKLKTNNFSHPQLIIFILTFSAIGFIIIKSFAAPNPALSGDLNNDNTVNVTDMSILLSNYGTANSTADINGDGTVNILDMSILLSNYGKTVTSFTTSITPSMTITPPYTWTFNPGVASVSGQFWADGTKLFTTTPDSSGAYKFVLQPGVLTAGTHTLGHSYDTADGVHHPAIGFDYTVTIAGTTFTGPGTGYTGPWRNTSYTIPSSFTKTITTASAFKSLVGPSGSLVAGDVVHVVGPLKIDGCAGCHTDIQKRLSSPASIYFDSNVVFAGDTNTTVGYYSVGIEAMNIYMYGGQVAGGQANDGIRVGPNFSAATAGADNVRWWGLKIHDTGGTGILAGGLKNSSGVWLGSNNIDIDAEIWNVCQQPQNDPHTVKGTGQHAIYVGNTSSDPPGAIMLNNSKFSIYSHDTSTCVGDAQIGQSVQNSEFWVRVANLPFADSAGGWTAARAMTPWTGASSPYNDKNIIVHDVEAHNISGPVVATDSLHSGPVTVEYGRAVSTLTWSTAKSYFNSNPFQPNSNVIYQNIQ